MHYRIYSAWCLAVNFHKKLRWNAVKKKFAAYFLHIIAVNARNRGQLFTFNAFSVFLKKEASLHRFESLTSCMPSTYSTATTVTPLYDISCQFESDWVNVGKQMQLNIVWKAVNLAANFVIKAVNFFSLNSPLSPHFSQRFAQKSWPRNQWDLTCRIFHPRFSNQIFKRTSAESGNIARNELRFAELFSLVIYWLLCQ